jgi:hypothetical protein
MNLKEAKTTGKSWMKAVTEGGLRRKRKDRCENQRFHLNGRHN